MRRATNLMPAVALVLLMGLGTTSCATKKDTGTLAGAGAGAVVGGLVGGGSAAGILIGAALGGAAGRFIGNYMDKQAKEIEEEVPEAQVERVAEGINVTFDSSLLFDVGKADLSMSAKETLASLSNVLVKYEDTEIMIEGHTDSTGSAEGNMALSKRRAEAVQINLMGNGVHPSRLKVEAYGETQPIAPNDTEWGRQQNRRVEFAIYANDDLQEEAKVETEG